MNLEKNTPTTLANFRLTADELQRLDINAEAHKKVNPLIKGRTAFLRLFLRSLPDNAVEADALAKSGAVNSLTSKNSRASLPA